MKKRDAWRDERVATEYETRRFARTAFDALVSLLRGRARGDRGRRRERRDVELGERVSARGKDACTGVIFAGGSGKQKSSGLEEAFKLDCIEPREAPDAAMMTGAWAPLRRSRSSSLRRWRWGWCSR